MKSSLESISRRNIFKTSAFSAISGLFTGTENGSFFRENLDDARLVTSRAYSTLDAMAVAGNAATDLDYTYLTEAGLEGKFVFSAADLSNEVTADRTQSIYVANASDTTGAGGGWVRKTNVVTPEITGLLNGTDDVAALRAAHSLSDEERSFEPKRGKVYAIGEELDLSGSLTVDVQSTIVTTGSGMVMAGAGSSRNNGHFQFRSVTDNQPYNGFAPIIPLLRVRGAKTSYFNIGRCRFLELLADGSDAANTSIAYNEFRLGYVPHIRLRGIEHGKPNSAWINENRFKGGRVDTLKIEGGYSHNHNHFIDSTFEGSDVLIEFGRTETGGGRVNNNWIRRARFENTVDAQITFGPETFNNVVMVSHTEFDYSFLKSPNVKVDDQSGLNFVMFEHEALGDKILAAEFDPVHLVATSDSTSSVNNTACRPNVPNGTKPAGKVRPGIIKSEITARFKHLCATEILPAYKGMQGIFVQDVPINALRYHIGIWDANMRPLSKEGVGGAYVESTWISSLNADGHYSAGSNHDNNTIYDFAVVREEVAFIQLAIAVGNVNPKQIGKQQIWLFDHPNHRPLSARGNMHQRAIGVLPSVPTKGAPPVGAEVMKDDGTEVYRSIYQHRSTVNGAHGKSATSIAVNDPGTISDDDVVGILLDDGVTHWSAVSALSGDRFTISPLPSASSDGSAVIFCRWATV